MLHNLINAVRKSLIPAASGVGSSSIRSEAIPAIRQLMDRLTPHDFLLKPIKSQYYLGRLEQILYGSPKITMVPLHEDKDFTIGLFIFPAKASLPLHDHPSMTVFSRILYGKMMLKAYDWIPPRHQDQIAPVPANHGETPKLAKLTINDVVTPSTPTHVTFPDQGGNVHAFTALEPSVLLDVIVPPYNDTDRQCTYFEEVDVDDENDDEEEENYDDDEDEDEEVDEDGNPIHKAWLLPGEPHEDFVCSRASEDDLDVYFHRPKTK